MVKAKKHMLCEKAPFLAMILGFLIASLVIGIPSALAGSSFVGQIVSCIAEYIENHFDEIISHESEVEIRMVEADCTIAGLTADNKRYVDGFQKAGEHVVIIDGDYEETIEILLNGKDY